MIEKIIIGQEIHQMPLRLEKVVEKRADGVICSFADRSDSVSGFVSDVVADGVALESGTVYTVDAVVVVLSMKPFLKVKQISPCKEYSKIALYGGISEEQRDHLIKVIRNIQVRMGASGYKALVEACLTDEHLLKLSELPATHGEYGTYIGGALVATASVAQMCLTGLSGYVSCGNGFTHMQPKWNALMAAILLHTFARGAYTDEEQPFKKSVVGLQMNYYACLQHELERVIREKNVPITGEEFSFLLNILSVVSRKSDTSPASKEGVIFRHFLHMFAECDMFDYEVKAYDGEEEYFYSEKLNRYILTQKEKKNGGD